MNKRQELHASAGVEESAKATDRLNELRYDAWIEAAGES